MLHCRIEFATANKLRTELEERNRQLRWLACRVIALERKLFVEGRQKVWRPTGIKGRGEPTNEGTAGRVMFVLSEELEMPHPAGDMGWEMAFNPEKGVYMWMKREKVEAIPLSAPRMPGEWREEW